MVRLGLCKFRVCPSFPYRSRPTVNSIYATEPNLPAIMAFEDAKNSSDGSVPQNPLTESFDEIVLAALKEWKVPGCSIAVVDHDQVFQKVMREN